MRDIDDTSGSAETWEAVFGTLARLAQSRCTAQCSDGVWMFPHYAEHGRWVRLRAGVVSDADGEEYEHGNWTAGFWFGIQWLVARAGVADSVSEVKRLLRLLAPRATDTTTHDLGFLFYPSFVLGRGMGFLNDSDIEPALTAARTLAARFNGPGQYIQAFGPLGSPRWRGTSTLDTMMNLPLLWWARAYEGGSQFDRVSCAHARTSGRVFLREDGSSFHLVRFDHNTGAVIWRGTFQGDTSASCWSRGQAWLLTGSAWAYAVTGEEEFRSMALRAWQYWSLAWPKASVPPWDFAADASEWAADSSAAAIMSLGLWILGHVDGDRFLTECAERYARALVDSCVSRSAGQEDGLLDHSCYSKPHGLGMDGATSWGDFYLLLLTGLLSGRVLWQELLGTEVED